MDIGPNNLHSSPIHSPVNKHFIYESLFGNRLYLGVTEKPIDGSDYGIRSYSKVIGWILSKLSKKIEQIDLGNGKTYINMNSLAQWEFRKISSYLDSKHLNTSSDEEEDEAIVLARATYTTYKKKGYDPKIIEAIRNQFSNKVLNIETVNNIGASIKEVLETCTELDALALPPLRNSLANGGDVLEMAFSTDSYIKQLEDKLKRPINKNEKTLVFKHLSTVLMENSDDKTKKLVEDYFKRLIQNLDWK